MLLGGALASFLAVGFACDGKSDQNPGPGSGGALGSGGAVGSGGSASGGAVGVGGAASGGALGTGGLDLGGSTSTGGIPGQPAGTGGAISKPVDFATCMKFDEGGPGVCKNVGEWKQGIGEHCDQLGLSLYITGVGPSCGENAYESYSYYCCPKPEPAFDAGM